MGRRSPTLLEVDADLFFLVSLQPDDKDRAVNFITNTAGWQEILNTARINGWKPLGTVLDAEFQYAYALSVYEDEPDEDEKTKLRHRAEARCAKWRGEYLPREYQLVTAEDAHAMRRALMGTPAKPELLNFLSYGAFRVAG